MNKFFMATTAILMTAAVSPVFASADHSHWEEIVARREAGNSAYAAVVREEGKSAKQDSGELLFPQAKHEKNK